MIEALNTYLMCLDWGSATERHLAERLTIEASVQVGDALLELKSESVEDDAAEPPGSATRAEVGAKGTDVAAQPAGEPQPSSSTQQASPTHSSTHSSESAFKALC